MTKFAYNNAKNANINYMLFELNCKYYFYALLKKNIDPRSRSLSADELLSELQKLITVCCNYFFQAHVLQKQAYDKDVKLKSYAPSDKVWLNSKYIKTK